MPKHSEVDTSTSILLLRPPLLAPVAAHTIAICPPLGLAYLAGTLKDAGYQSVHALDAIGEAVFQRVKIDDGKYLYYGLTPDQICERIARDHAGVKILGVSIMFSHEWPVAKELVKRIKKEQPGLFVVCGGEHITAAPE